MMVTLQRIQQFFVRATYNDMYRGESVSITEVSLDVSVEAKRGRDRGAEGSRGREGYEKLEGN